MNGHSHNYWKLDYAKARQLERAAWLRSLNCGRAEIQHGRDLSGSPHPRCQEFDELTTTIQMRLGNLAFEQAVALAA